MHKSTLPSPHSPLITLPAAPEHDWRFSYQFTANRSRFLTRLVIGMSIVGLMIVVVKAAW